MRKSLFISSILTFIGALGLTPSSVAKVLPQDYQFVEGDVLVQKENRWKTVKILNVEKLKGNSEVTLHVMFYEESKNKPTLSNMANFPVEIFHVPIDAKEFKHSWEWLGNTGVKTSDLVGFLAYLKQTHFSRYVEMTNQNMDELVSLANAKYRKAYALAEQHQFNEAIALYSEAVELFPLFIEAIDNIAFAYMDMGDNERAIEYFDQSLKIESNGFTALYYKGKCLINIGELDSAIAIFKDGMSRFPEKRAAFEEVYLTLKKILSNRNG